MLSRLSWRSLLISTLHRALLKIFMFFADSRRYSGVRTCYVHAGWFLVRKCKDLDDRMISTCYVHVKCTIFVLLGRTTLELISEVPYFRSTRETHCQVRYFVQWRSLPNRSPHSLLQLSRCAASHRLELDLPSLLFISHTISYLVTACAK